MTEESLNNFVSYCQKHLKGDEKGEAQIFLEHFFVAMGHPEGVKGAGATLEERIKSQDKRSTRFADLVWKPRVLIEMKKRGENLAVHYQQAFQYWIDLVPDRPQYVVLCNFDEFWIYDFNKLVYEPLDKVALTDLPQKRASFSFLYPKFKHPVFKTGEDITKDIAQKIAYIFKSLTTRKIERIDALRYCLQCIVTMFAEDVGLLPNQVFTRLLQDCIDRKESSYDLIGGLFQEMNRLGTAPAGRYEGVEYFNGGLFEKIIPIELTHFEIEMLFDASKRNWFKVNPAIFGTIFQTALEKGERHVLGAHYTAEIDIKKIVLPCIVQPWQAQIDQAQTLDEHLALLTALSQYTVLDPSCGSGNFLFVAFKEMKLLEAQILDRIRNRFTKPAEGKKFFQFLNEYTYVNTAQFYGYDIKPFAVELAKVTLMVAKELSYIEYKESFDSKFKPLPLDNLDDNILCIDALLDDQGNARQWHKVDVIIGNPPFQARSKMLSEFGKEYLEGLWKAYPDLNRYGDFCTLWFYKAHQTLKPNHFAGLVGTNSIRENNSRENSLDYIVNNGGTIFNAVSSQNWEGEAAVFVSIVNWVKGNYLNDKILFVINEEGELKPHTRTFINSSLSLHVDVSTAAKLSCNKLRKYCSQGLKHGHEGFLLTPAQAKTYLKADKKNADVLKPYLIGRELVASFASQPKRFVIDFSQLDVIQTAGYKELFKHIQKTVYFDRKALSDKQQQENQKLLAKNPKIKVDKSYINYYKTWWQLIGKKTELIKELSSMKKYIACSRVSLRPIFEFISTEISPNDQLMVFTFEDDYSFGILQSCYHWEWWKAKCSTLKGDYRYTADTVWYTFPFPQNPSEKQVKAVADAALTLRKARTATMQKNQWSLRNMYGILDLYSDSNPIKKLHQALDKAVREAYGFAPNSDILTELLLLNQSVHQREVQGLSVQAPGLPDFIKNPQDYVSADCVKWEG